MGSSILRPSKLSVLEELCKFLIWSYELFKMSSHYKSSSDLYFTDDLLKPFLRRLNKCLQFIKVMFMILCRQKNFKASSVVRQHSKFLRPLKYFKKALWSIKDLNDFVLRRTLQRLLFWKTFQRSSTHESSIVYKSSLKKSFRTFENSLIHIRF